jgi:hypothetical protein
MKRMIIFLLVFLFTTSFAFSQAVDAGNKIINLNVGFVTQFNNGNIQIPPITASFDYIVTQAGPGYIGLGAMAGYATAKEELRLYPGNYYTYDFILLGARGTYHWFPGQNDKIDTYAGVTIGYNLVSHKYTGFAGPTDISQKSAMLGGMFAGIRYFIIPKLGINAEFSYGVSAVSIGGSFKF